MTLAGQAIIVRAMPRSCRSCAGIHPLPQFLARREVRHLFRRNQHRFTGLWIASSPRWPVVQRKASEPAYINAISVLQRIAQSLNDRFDRQFAIFGDELRVAGSEAVDEFGTGHGGTFYVVRRRARLCACSLSGQRRHAQRVVWEPGDSKSPCSAAEGSDRPNEDWLERRVASKFPRRTPVPQSRH